MNNDKRWQGRTTAAKAVVLSAGIIFFMSGCGDYDSDYSHSAVCMDKKTNTRIDDTRCGDGNGDGSMNGLFGWYYVPLGQTAPSVGARPAPGVGSYVKPSGGGVSVQKGGVDTKDGTVSRGGLGSTGSGSNGGKGGGSSSGG